MSNPTDQEIVEALRKSLAHWNRMRDWAKQQPPNDIFNSGAMGTSIGEIPGACDCALCLLYEYDCKKCLFHSMPCITPGSIYRSIFREGVLTTYGRFVEDSKKMIHKLQRALDLRSDAIEVMYDGAFPNLCAGTLQVRIGKKLWKFRDHSLQSSGDAYIDEDGEEYVNSGPWVIREWPKGFPYSRREAVLNAINDKIPHGCCGGCI